MACAAQLGQTGTSTASDQGHIPSVKGQHYSGRGEAAQEDLPAAGQSKAAEALFEIAVHPLAPLMQALSTISSQALSNNPLQVSQVRLHITS